MLLFGITAGLTQELTSALGSRALVGFPAASGVCNGGVVRYVLIRQQKTMLAEADGSITSCIRGLAAVLACAGFPTAVSRDAEGWLIAHAAFVAPIAFALYRAGVDPNRLASDTSTLRPMVRATRQAFQALQACGNSQIPRDLRALFLYAPERLAVRDTCGASWHRTTVQLWFAGHTRAAPQEMTSLRRGGTRCGGAQPASGTRSGCSAEARLLRRHGAERRAEGCLPPAPTTSQATAIPVQPRPTRHWFSGASAPRQQVCVRPADALYKRLRE